MLRDRLVDHSHYVREHGDDMPEIKSWKWTGRRSGGDERGRRKDID
jgi:hypothetical protein